MHGLAGFQMKLICKPKIGIKRNNSRFQKYKGMIKSPKYRTKNNSINSDLINSNIENKKSKKYKSINNEKKITIFLSNENSKITKK